MVMEGSSPLEHDVQNLCFSKLCIFGHIGVTRATQVFQHIVKVVEQDTNPVDLHFGFIKHYQDHELLGHVHEAIPLQPDALDQSKHPNIVCRNPNLRFTTKAKACKVVGQEGSSRVTSHVLGSAKECEV
jgi:hypothetical protein